MQSSERLCIRTLRVSESTQVQDFELTCTQEELTKALDRLGR